LSSTGFPINGQKRLLTPIAVPTNVVETPTAVVHVSDLAADDAEPGQVLTLGYDGLWRAQNATGGSSTPQYVAVTTDYSAASADDIIGVDATAVKVTVTLADPASCVVGHQVLIKDIAGTASAHTIAFATAGGSIDDSTLITTDKGFARFFTNGTNWYKI